MKIDLSNYRLLKPTEHPRKGDIYIGSRHFNTGNEGVMPIDRSDSAVSTFPNFRFYRRLHTKKVVVVPVVFQPKYNGIRSIVPSSSDTKKKLIVNFRYKGQWRAVQVISLDMSYITGLERLDYKGEGKFKWQFKKFFRHKAEGLTVESYE